MRHRAHPPSLLLDGPVARTFRQETGHRFDDLPATHLPPPTPPARPGERTPLPTSRPRGAYPTRVGARSGRSRRHLRRSAARCRVVPPFRLTLRPRRPLPRPPPSPPAPRPPLHRRPALPLG